MRQKILQLILSVLFFQKCLSADLINLKSKLSVIPESIDNYVPKIQVNGCLVDEYIKQIMDCHSMFATAVAIVQLSENDTLIDDYVKGYGTLDITKIAPEPADATTKFCIGSMTKQFTAGVLGKQLMSMGKDFDTQLITLLGEDGRFFNRINLGDIPTIRDLLSHRMSIPTYDNVWTVGLEEKREDVWKRLHHLGDYDIKYLAKNYRSRFEYNNFMMSLSGYILQTLTGQRWEDEIIKNYFLPLNMTDAEFFHTAVDYDNFAKTAYNIIDSTNQTIFKLIDPQYIRATLNMIAPSGSICLSADDMLKYLTFLLTTEVDEELAPLKDSVNKNWAEASNIWRANNGESDSSVPPGFVHVSDEYGLGWLKGFYKNYQQVSHFGDIYGYKSMIYVFPTIKIAIMVSSSQGYNTYSYAQAIALGLFDMITNTTKDITADSICRMNPDPTPMPDPDTMKPFETCQLTADPINLEPLTGVYNHEVFGNLTIAYNESAELKFRFGFGLFGSGALCRMIGTKIQFKIFFDVDGPLWYSNADTVYSQQMVEFKRDAGTRGTRVVVPYIEPNAPTIESQTFYKVGYNPCAPSPCQNGATCIPMGEFDFKCTCPAMVVGAVCEIGPRRDCSDLKKYYPHLSHESGLRPIQDPLEPNSTVNVYCDMMTAGGGWTVIHRRVNDNNTFDVSYEAYKASIGSGAVEDNFWFGLDRMSKLAFSSQSGYTLRIDLEDCDNFTAFEEYKNFWLGGEGDSYTLHVDSNSDSGSAGDALTINNQYANHNGRPFTTIDHDLNDPNHCAYTYNSGWWFNDCFAANLNGQYYANCQSVNGGGIIWLPWRGSKMSLKYAQMMIRRTV